MLSEISKIKNDLDSINALLNKEDDELRLLRHLISMARLELERAEETNTTMQEYGLSTTPCKDDQRT